MGTWRRCVFSLRPLVPYRRHQAKGFVDGYTGRSCTTLGASPKVRPQGGLPQCPGMRMTARSAIMTAPRAGMRARRATAIALRANVLACRATAIARRAEMLDMRATAIAPGAGRLARRATATARRAGMLAHPATPIASRAGMAAPTNNRDCFACKYHCTASNRDYSACTRACTPSNADCTACSHVCTRGHRDRSACRPDGSVRRCGLIRTARARVRHSRRRKHADADRSVPPLWSATLRPHRTASRSSAATAGPPPERHARRLLRSVRTPTLSRLSLVHLGAGAAGSSRG
jgi:hypothetical protein